MHEYSLRGNRLLLAIVLTVLVFAVIGLLVYFTSVQTATILLLIFLTIAFFATAYKYYADPSFAIPTPTDMTFDHQEWCKSAVQKNLADPNDIDATFAYVRQNHPWGGTAYDQTRRSYTVNGTESLEDLTQYADAVARICSHPLGYRNRDSLRPEHLDSRLGVRREVDAIGAIALIALTHRDPDIRNFHLELVRQWRKLF